MIAVRLIGVLVLVALNGFFAAAEFSLVAVRLSRVRQLVQKGNARARIVERGDAERRGNRDFFSSTPAFTAPAARR